MTESTKANSMQKLIFPQGIPGFEDQTSYNLFHTETESGRVYWIESDTNPEITFTFVDPNLYGLNYELELTDEEQTLLQVEKPDDVAVMLMLWKLDEPEQAAKPGLNANIAGPILINVEKHIGMQKVLASPKIELNISE